MLSFICGKPIEAKFPSRYWKGEVDEARLTDGSKKSKNPPSPSRLPIHQD